MGDDFNERSLEGGSDFNDPFLLNFREVQEVLLLPRPGDLLGGQQGKRFEIRERLGRGGMGQVFRAWDSVLQRHVALKFIQPQEEDSGVALTSLLKEEARAIARLDHENIVRIFDVSEWRARDSVIIPFLVMECLKGDSLSARLRQGALAWEKALPLFRGVLAGLAHAHAHQVIHRDLKPSNVFILEGGRAKLLDFGLARLGAGDVGRGPYPGGSPPYMAPEQWLDEAQDARTDVWAAGLLFHVLLTGQHPCVSCSADALREWALAARPLPSVRDSRPELPAEVDTLIARATAREPARRLPTIHALAERLDAIERRLEAAREAPPPPRRGQVTFLCCVMARPPDPVNDPLDDEALGELQDRFHRACSERLRRQGATVLQCLGDEVLACLGHPRAEEDAPLRAVRVGLELASLPHEDFSVRVGIHTAAVVMSTLPTARHSGASAAVQGEAHLLATWVARQAEPGTALLTQSTYQGLRGAFITEPLASSAVRASPSPLHRLIREREEPLRFERMCPPALTPLVGRSDELRQLRALWERAKAGQGTLVLVQGEAGIGKSRLLRELREQVASEVGVQAQAQCWQETRNSPLYPFCQLLLQLFDLPRNVSPEEQRRLALQRLESLGLARPEQMSLLEPLFCLPGHEVPPTGGAERRQEQLLELLTTLLLELTGARSETARPALLVIEDLHWADPSTLDLLARMGEHLRSARLCLLLSARPEPRRLAAHMPGIHTVVLPRLSPEQALDLAARVMRGQPLSEEALRHLGDKTDGIPLFVEELARMLLREPTPSLALAGSPGVPIPLQSLLQARLDSLPPEQRDLARRCAVIGRGFTLPLVAACVHSRGEALRRGLTALVRAGLLCRHDEAHDARYEFRHALLQEQARESLPRPERRQVHQCIARYLAAHPMLPTEFPPEWVAHHFTEAQEWAEAHRWWMDAGRLAMRRLAYTEAVHHYQQARSALARLPRDPGHKLAELRLLLELGVPMLVTRCGAHELKDLFLRAQALCHETGATELLPPAISGLFFWHLERADYPRALDTAKALIELGEDASHPEARAVGCLRMGLSLFLQGNPRPAMDYLEQALAAMGPDFDPEWERSLCRVYCYSPRVLSHVFLSIVRLYLEGPVPRARSDCEQALRYLEPLRCPMTESVSLVYAGIFFQQAGDEARVLDLTGRIVPLLTRYNLSTCMGIAEALRGWALERRGVDGALREPIERWVSWGMRKGLSYCFGLLAQHHLERGELEPGLEAVKEGLGWVEALGEHAYEPSLHLLRGQLLWLRGDADGARRSLQTALAVARAQETGYFERRVTEALETPR